MNNRSFSLAVRKCFVDLNNYGSVNIDGIKYKVNHKGEVCAVNSGYAIAYCKNLGCEFERMVLRVNKSLNLKIPL